MSKEALKMKGMPSASVMSRSRPATSITSASLSMTHGPAIRKNGRSAPTSNEASFMPWREPAGAMRDRPVPHGRIPQTTDDRLEASR